MLMNPENDLHLHLSKLVLIQIFYFIDVSNICLNVMALLNGLRVLFCTDSCEFTVQYDHEQEVFSYSLLDDLEAEDLIVQ